MVRKSERDKMRTFVCDRLEAATTDSGASRYVIQRANDSGILFAQNPDLVEKPVTIDVVLHANPMTISNYKARVASNYREGRPTADVFYKNGRDFMVRLAGSAVGRDDKALKNYDHQQLNAMIHLRGLEKAALNFQSSGMLVYFQPKTDRLEESLRGYDMLDVELDYSHIPPDSQKADFVKNRTSIDYKIPDEQFNTDGACVVVGFKNDKRKVHIVPVGKY